MIGNHIELFLNKKLFIRNYFMYLLSSLVFSNWEFSSVLVTVKGNSSISGWTKHGGVIGLNKMGIYVLGVVVVGLIVLGETVAGVATGTGTDGESPI